MFRWIRGKEPVMVAAFVVVLVIAVAIWLMDLAAGPIAAVASVAVVIVGFITRQAVVPLAKLIDVVTTLNIDDDSKLEPLPELDPPGLVRKTLRTIGGLFR